MNQSTLQLTLFESKITLLRKIVQNTYFQISMYLCAYDQNCEDSGLRIVPSDEEKIFDTENGFNITQLQLGSNDSCFDTTSTVYDATKTPNISYIPDYVINICSHLFTHIELSLFTNRPSEIIGFYQDILLLLHASQQNVYVQQFVDTFFDLIFSEITDYFESVIKDGIIVKFIEETSELIDREPDANVLALSNACLQSVLIILKQHAIEVYNQQILDNFTFSIKQIYSRFNMSGYDQNALEYIREDMQTEDDFPIEFQQINKDFKEQVKELLYKI